MMIRSSVARLAGVVAALPMLLGAAPGGLAGKDAEPASINYPHIFGVRPGAPFHLRMPVSGARPGWSFAKRYRADCWI